MKLHHSIFVVPGFVSLLLLTACTSPSGSFSDVDASPECIAAATEAVRVEEDLYANHPLYDADLPGIDATEDERAAYDALQADEEAQWMASQIPVFQSCDGPAEWLAMAKQYPLIANSTDGEYVDTGSLELWCEQRPEDASCVGLAEWVADHGSAWDR